MINELIASTLALSCVLGFTFAAFAFYKVRVLEAYTYEWLHPCSHYIAGTRKGYQRDLEIATIMLWRTFMRMALALGTYPFIAAMMVAHGGYSLPGAFSLCVIALGAWFHYHGKQLVRFLRHKQIAFLTLNTSSEA
jgi:hypothetical protein